MSTNVGTRTRDSDEVSWSRLAIEHLSSSVYDHLLSSSFFSLSVVDIKLRVIQNEDTNNSMNEINL